MTTKKNLAITEAAQRAGNTLASWEAVEAEAQRRLEAGHEAEPGNSFAEFHFCNGAVQGVIKADPLPKVWDPDSRVGANA